MGLPPVFVGLIVAMTLSRRGPLGDLDLLYSQTAMVIAQVIIAVPVIVAVTAAAVSAVPRELRLQARSLGAPPLARRRCSRSREARMGLIAAVAAGFGAIISEVGAVQMVGGNLEGDTRVMTTAIVQFTRKGQYGTGAGARARAHGDRGLREHRADDDADVGRPLGGGRPMSGALSLARRGPAQVVPQGRLRARRRRASRSPAGQTLALLGPSRLGQDDAAATSSACSRSRTRDACCSTGARSSTRDREARLQMAAVFQRPYLFKGTVGGNVAYGLALRGVPRAERHARVAAALERVGLAGYEERSALALSGGEAQRVSLARALVLEPARAAARRAARLPRPAAQAPAHARVRDASCATTGVTVVYVTHDQDEASSSPTASRS